MCACDPLFCVWSHELAIETWWAWIPAIWRGGCLVYVQVHMDLEDLAQWDVKYSNKWLLPKGFLPVLFGPRGTLRKTRLFAALIISMGLILPHRSKITFSIMCDCALPSPVFSFIAVMYGGPNFQPYQRFWLMCCYSETQAVFPGLLQSRYLHILSSLSSFLLCCLLVASLAAYLCSSPSHHWLVHCPLSP